MDSHADTLEKSFEINWAPISSKSIEYKRRMAVYFNSDKGTYELCPEAYESVAEYKAIEEVTAFIHGFNTAMEFQGYFKNLDLIEEGHAIADRAESE